MTRTRHKEKPREAEADARETNGRSTHAADGQTSDRPALERAEDMVDHFGEQLGQFASQAGQTLNRWLARAREEAEDMWAEAQSLRAGWKSPPSTGD